MARPSKLLRHVEPGALICAVVRKLNPLRLGARYLWLLASTSIISTPALAQDASSVVGAFGAVRVIETAVFAGVLGAAMLSALWLIRERAQIAAENVDLRARVSDLNALLQRSESLLNLKDQCLIVWRNDQPKPDLVGSLPAGSGAPDERAGFLAFGRWLTANSATGLERAIIAMKDEGTTFDLICKTLNGTLLEVQGRTSAHHAVARFVSHTNALADHVSLKADYQQIDGEYQTLRALAEEAPMPFWTRDKDGKLRWVNRAYAKAVDAADGQIAIDEQREFLNTTTLEAIRRHHAADAVYTQKASTVIDGDRSLFAVTDVVGKNGTAGLAADITEIETLRAEYERALHSHSETLDQLNTAVAIFDAEEKLRFYNQAFQKLWNLDTVFLASEPDNTLLLDRLRSDGTLPEQPEWRRWQENLLAAYRAVDSQEHWWHLPDGRSIRVIANPQPKGGVTWVFENLTEKIDLESRYNNAVKVQGETLDNLAEGVAVFGADGRIRLFNPAFAHLWGLPVDLIAEKIHISVIRAACDPLVTNSPWSDFVAAVTGFDDERHERTGKVELLDGTVLSYALVPLSNGQMMMTFVDDTDTTNIERALKEKNEALQRADKLKNDFVQHVSYELRSPLTNIIGFTELLEMQEAGPLEPKQHEYIDHISTSSSTLLTIVNDILDLATVDAGIMELDLGEVEIRETVREAGDLLGERLREHDLRLEIDLDGAPEHFHADGQRIRQILFNLLTNAANYAPEGSAITLTCGQTDGHVEFSVHDSGPGIPSEALDTVFERFTPRSSGGRRRGAGLGLAIVKSFVELHGGEVVIDTGESKGTTVLCRFPDTPEKYRVAAE